MKKLSILLIVVLVLGAAVGCSSGEPAEEPAEEPEQQEEADVVTTASIVDTEEAFKAAIAADGTWIAGTLADLTFEEELVLEGTIDHEGTEERKIALYEQDEDRNITAEYTLTTPKLTIKSDNTRIKGGTLEGDLHVAANNVQLQHHVVTGDITFASQEYKDSFAMDEDSSVEGEMVVEGADVVTTASIVNTEEAFKAAIAADGTWIAGTLADLTFEEELVLEGTIDHDGTEERKIALYEQDEDRNITAEYTLTTPKLTIKSANTRIKGGTLEGDLYVAANNVQLQHHVVTGDVTFASQEYKDSFTMDEDSSVEGEMIVE